MLTRRLKIYLENFNLFQGPHVTNNRHQLRNQIISTRIFLVLFSIILFAVFIYLLAADFTNSITVEAPSLTDYKKLNTRYKDTLQCPCSNLSILYRSFISLESRMHQICYLDMNPLIDSLFQFTGTLTNHRDFRFTAALEFRLLTLLCSSINQLINTRLIDFNATVFSSAFIIDEISLHEQAKELINQFIQSTTSQLINSLQMIRINNFGSQFMSGVRSNYLIIGTKIDGKAWYYSTFTAYSQLYDNNCNCSTSFLCTSSSKIYTDNRSYDILGFRTGCFVLESLLASSLECFYDSSCINQLHQFIPFNSTISLPSSTQFNKTDSIETMLNELMVEEWSISVNYTNYFDACQTRTCSYSFVGHRSFLFIITTMLSLIGGLAPILQILIPLIVAYTRRKKSTVNVSGSSNLIHRFRRSINQINIMKKMRLVNLFRSDDSHTEHDIRNEFLSTRIYLLLLFATLIITTEYYAFIINVSTITLHSPSFDSITQSNETTLVCPCSTSLIPRETFVSIKAIFHPICSSEFITDTWLNALDTSVDDEIIRFRVPFRLLSLFCQLAYQTLDTQFQQFYTSRFLSIQLFTEDQIKAQTIVDIDKAISVARSTFSDSLERIRNISEINLLMSANEIFETNQAHFTISIYGRMEFHNIFENELGDLFCNISARLANITFDQFFSRCGGIKSILISSLVSLYDINKVEAFNNLIINSSSRPLNQSSVYSKMATIQSILNGLMLDRYVQNISYRSYFDKCHPKSCTYSITNRQTFIAIVLALIGLFGGLMTVLHFGVGLTVKFLTRPKKPRRPKIPWRQSARLLVNFRREFLRSFNLFRHSGNTHWHEIMSTRIFVFTFSVIFLIFLFQISLSWTTVLVTISKPTYEQFVKLDNQYPTTLTCPCSSITVSQWKFITFAPQIHQVCSSDFISDKYLSYLYEQTLRSYESYDFRTSGYYTFYSISLLCKLSQKVVEERIDTFSATQFASRKVLNKERLQQEIDELFRAFAQVGEQQLLIAIRLIRDVTYSNQFISNTLSNINMTAFPAFDFIAANQTLNVTDRQYSTCNCLTSSFCVQPAGFRDFYSPPIYLRGFYVGCYMLEAVLVSSAHCLFSLTCVNYMAYGSAVRGTAFEVNLLDSTRNSSYSVNTTFAEMLNHLMVETWGRQVSHQAYYDACLTLSCTYSYVARREFVYILTIVFGFLGGLNSVLRLFIPRFVTIILYIRDRNRIIPEHNRS